jgi:malonate-semialdehyde dehydrogenase (acetylating)/methylmalonate-semialdehyde dehydrogenase
MAISVAVAVGESTAEELIRRLLPKIDALKIGSGMKADAEMGPVVTGPHLNKVKGYIDLGVAEGADLLADGRQHANTDSGFFVGASLFDHVTPEMRIYRDEIFGPVLCMVRVSDFDAAMKLVNDHEFGNGAAIFTRDGDSARAFASAAKAGMIGVNVPIPVPVAFHSFGGWKRSLFGDHYVYGPEGVRFYTRLKTITARWPTGIRKGADFHFPLMG